MQSRLNSLLKDKGYTIHSISPELTIYECAKIMSQLRVGALLVIEDEELVGILSERDIIRKIVSCNCDINNIKVAEIMTKDLITVPPTMTVTDAMRLITEKRFRHLPVVDNGKLIGIISIGDLTRWAMLSQEQEIDTLTRYIHGEKQL